MPSVEEWLAKRGAPPPTATTAAPREDDAVARAMTYARNSLAQAPKSEARLRDAMTRKGFDDDTIDAALPRCRDEGLVDDAAFATSLVREWRAKGHAGPRLTADLRRRGFTDETIATVLEDAAPTDPEAEAFAIALDRAQRLRGVALETAYGRIVGYLLRRGHPDATARKVARHALFADREPQRIAEH